MGSAVLHILLTLLWSSLCYVFGVERGRWEFTVSLPADAFKFKSLRISSSEAVVKMALASELHLYHS